MKVTENEIDLFIDLFMVNRGEHPSRVRNPIYSKERALSKNVAFAVIALIEKKESKIILDYTRWLDGKELSELQDCTYEERINLYLKNHF